MTGAGSERPPGPVLIVDPPVRMLVFLIAFGAAMVFSLPTLLGRGDMAICCGQNCIGASVGCSLGVLPVMVAWRHGARLSRGMGCAIPMLGVFMGGVVGAIVQISFPPLDSMEVRDQASRVFRAAVERLQRDGRPVDLGSEADFVEAMRFASRYGVILLGAGSAIIAGGVGLLASRIAGRLRLPQPRSGRDEGGS